MTYGRSLLVALLLCAVAGAAAQVGEEEEDEYNYGGWYGEEYYEEFEDPDFDEADYYYSNADYDERPVDSGVFSWLGEAADCRVSGPQVIVNGKLPPRAHRRHAAPISPCVVSAGPRPRERGKIISIILYY